MERVPPKMCEGRRFTISEETILHSLAHSTNSIGKRCCVDYLEAAAATNRSLVFELAPALIPFRSTRVRWGTQIILGTFCRTHPEELWSVVLEWGRVSSKDIRTGVACCILEHILEWHFEEYFERVKEVAQEDRRFRFTLRMCAKFGKTATASNSAAYDAFFS